MSEKRRDVLEVVAHQIFDGGHHYYSDGPKYEGRSTPLVRLSDAVEEVRALREAIRNVADRRARPGESHNEHFERLAEMFRRETGRMAPGKDQGMEMGARDIGADRAAWESWCAAPYDALVALLPDTGDNDES